MTMTTTVVRRGPFDGDGSTVSFAFDFRIFGRTDMVVTVSTGGAPSVKTIDVDYTIDDSFVDNPAGGVVTFLTAPATGTEITLERVTPVTQDTDLVNQGGDYRETLERMVDRMTAMMQEMSAVISAGRVLALGVGDTPGSGAYEAGGNRIENLGAPSTSGDAATIDYVEDLVTGAVTGGGSHAIASWTDATANGVTTVFSISGATIASVNCYIVSVGGVIQIPGTYTIDVSVPASATITFDQAPPTGATINVRCIGYAPDIVTMPATEVVTAAVLGTMTASSYAGKFYRVWDSGQAEKIVTPLRNASGTYEWVVFGEGGF